MRELHHANNQMGRMNRAGRPSYHSPSEGGMWRFVNKLLPKISVLRLHNTQSVLLLSGLDAKANV
ncbi:hypothetical protein CEE69_04485 [Rhodopirellula bahusiensis]|uniref:Uncharacterized protein n=1 Tax=Rhodopirellula bahusiensis TaxID=2014065 RepID=A0A2G1WC66_9BACT|nr:hypothetical protein CEE69_04485 [Rhodopirellula bahusiensis]